MKVNALVVTVFVLFEAVSTSTVDNLIRDEWNGFKLEHNKVYKSIEEEKYRYSVYLKNRDFIAQHNQRFALGLETYDMGLNHLGDLTYEEVVQQYTSLGLS
jgi:Cathepsin propeptide inhibitor domain (I29)